MGGSDGVQVRREGVVTRRNGGSRTWLWGPVTGASCSGPGGKNIRAEWVEGGEAGGLCVLWGRLFVKSGVWGRRGQRSASQVVMTEGLIAILRTYHRGKPCIRREAPFSSWASRRERASQVKRSREDSWAADVRLEELKHSGFRFSVCFWLCAVWLPLCPPFWDLEVFAHFKF